MARRHYEEGAESVAEEISELPGAYKGSPKPRSPFPRCIDFHNQVSSTIFASSPHCNSQEPVVLISVRAGVKRSL